MQTMVFEDWIADWLMMAVISGIGSVVFVIILALLLLVARRCIRKLPSYFPDV